MSADAARTARRWSERFRRWRGVRLFNLSANDPEVRAGRADFVDSHRRRKEAHPVPPSPGEVGHCRRPCGVRALGSDPCCRGSAFGGRFPCFRRDVCEDVGGGPDSCCAGAGCLSIASGPAMQTAGLSRRRRAPETNMQGRAARRRRGEPALWARLSCAFWSKLARSVEWVLLGSVRSSHRGLCRPEVRPPRVPETRLRGRLP
jgi:hypothetical protein